MTLPPATFTATVAKNNGIMPECGQKPRRWCHRMIVAIKIIHSVIFLVNSAAVLHIFWVGVFNRRSRWTGLALVASIGESLVFVLNRGHCPLTGLVASMGAESGRVSDIFLPRWIADRIPQLCGPVLLIGVVALSARRLSSGIQIALQLDLGAETSATVYGADGKGRRTPPVHLDRDASLPTC